MIPSHRFSPQINYRTPAPLTHTRPSRFRKRQRSFCVRVILSSSVPTPPVDTSLRNGRSKVANLARWTTISMSIAFVVANVRTIFVRIAINLPITRATPVRSTRVGRRVFCADSVRNRWIPRILFFSLEMSPMLIIIIALIAGTLPVRALRCSPVAMPITSTNPTPRKNLGVACILLV